MTIYEPETPAAIRMTGVDFAFPHRSGRRKHIASGGASVNAAGDGGTAPPLLLKNFSLTVPQESITAILGPNGAGKTTLLNLILGWLSPRSGSISLFGRDSSGTSRREMGRTISLVPQEEHVPFEYTILDFVLLGRAPHLGPLQAPQPTDVAIARSALDTVGIAGLAHKSVAETSGGEKQLATIARALTQQSRILLMDEPTAHLDLKNKRRMVDLIHRLNRSGTTVIITTHDPEFASIAADRMVLLGNGRLLAEGPVEAVMTEKNLGTAFDMDLAVRDVPPQPGRPAHRDHTVVIW